MFELKIQALNTKLDIDCSTYKIVQKSTNKSTQKQLLKKLKRVGVFYEGVPNSNLNNLILANAITVCKLGHCLDKTKLSF